MPENLLIGVMNGNWTATIENTTIQYTFSGDSLEAQASNVEFFAKCMRWDEPVGAVSFFTETMGAQPDVIATVAQDLFGTSGLYLEGEMVFATGVGNETLFDYMFRAGEALLEDLAAL
jgi:hypothetical protein